MSNQDEKLKGITVKEVRDFLNSLPPDMNDFGLVNGEIMQLEEIYVRVDNPIIHLEVDGENREIMFLHQSKESIQKILKDIHGNTKAD